MNYEENARKNHKNGFNCAMSVYVAYCDKLGISPELARNTAPKPRSEGGKCGAFLAGKKILEQLKPEAVTDYEQRFIVNPNCFWYKSLPTLSRRSLSCFYFFW